MPDFDSFFENRKNIAAESTDDNIFMKNSSSFIEDTIINGTEEILSELKIDAKDIFVEINISENGNININKFTVTTENTGSVETLKEKIYKKTGIEPEIIISGEN